MERLREFVFTITSVIRNMADVFNIFFRERELILRSQGRVVFLRLTQRLQISAFLLAVTVGVWGVGMTVMSALKGHTIGVKNEEIREARVAYEDLFEEVLRYQKKVADVTSTLRQSQKNLLARVDEVAKDGKAGARRKTVTRSLGQIDPTDNASQPGEVLGLRQHLSALDHKVLQMTETNILLDGSLSKIKTELNLAGDERDNIIKTRTKLRERVGELEDNLIRARTEVAYLERRVGEVQSTLDTTRTAHGSVVKERTDLQQRVAGLETGLTDARGRAEGAELDLRQVLDKLERTTGGVGGETVATVVNESQDLDGAMLAGDTGSLRERTVALIGRLDDLHAAQGNVLDRLGERTVKNIEEAERLIAMTGLNLDAVLKRATKSFYGQGGPMIEVPDGEGLNGLPGSVSEIDSQLTRWSGLRALLKRIPMISPVDFYHKASDYGLRRDPMNKRRSVHYGVDLAGWRGAPVYATAPGRVVFAGRKGRFGLMVEIEHGYGVRTRYAHLLKILVKRGDEVSHRHKIALLGSSGRSTGPHVHYEIRFDGKPMNPSKFIRAGRYVFKG
jgi:murein DD-endopeptidase MepM/ murein hydrolase activator NlpD